MHKIIFSIISLILIQNYCNADFVENIIEPSGVKAYQEELKNVKQRHGINFDTPTLEKYYYALVDYGYSASEAWLMTMQKQDEYRASKDKRENLEKLKELIYIDDYEEYVNSLQNKMVNAPSADLKIRYNEMVKFAYKVTEENRALYLDDPALYFSLKDLHMPIANVNDPQYYEKKLIRLDTHYDYLGVKQSQRKYLTNEERKELSKEIKLLKNLNFKEKFCLSSEIKSRYKKKYMPFIINDLLKNELIDKNDVRTFDFSICKIVISTLLALLFALFTTYFVYKFKINKK